MKKILVIEDEAAFREAIVFALEGEGYKVIQAENGAEGIELARSNIPDLIISDVVMDSVGGYDAVVTLRQDPRTSGIPIILMTGKADKAGLVHAIELGADDYLAKPFTIPELFEAINVRFSKQEEMRQREAERFTDPRSYLNLGLPADLKTPIAGILGFSKALGREYAEMKKSEIVELGRAIEKAARNVLRIAENFSILAQLEIIITDPEKVQGLRKFKTPDVKEVLETVAHQVAERYERSDDLVLLLSPGAAAISGEYLGKLATELLDNAFKYSSRGQKVQVSTSTGNQGTSVVVTDSGRGLTADQNADVNAYESIHSRFHDQRYFGWGLVVAKRLAEIHGGTLQVTSAPGAGVICKATIPAA